LFFPFLLVSIFVFSAFGVGGWEDAHLFEAILLFVPPRSPSFRPGPRETSCWRARWQSTLAAGHRGTRREAVLTATSTAAKLELAGVTQASFTRTE
jgi:hypothetical protein